MLTPPFDAQLGLECWDPALPKNRFQARWAIGRGATLGVSRSVQAGGVGGWVPLATLTDVSLQERVLGVTRAMAISAFLPSNR